ncbi:MAG TPA: phosphatase PAP2 family protein [Candidatus Sulfopaludibacter sp.]|nr:phosphatase PAP2 family protein [Candidatus Sulfopaludibacter sp.]
MNKENKTLLAGVTVAVVAAVAFAVLAQAVMHGSTEAVDRSVRSAIHSWSNPLLTRVMLDVTELGQPWLLILLGAVLVWRFYSLGRRRAAVILALSALGGEACDQALKYSFARHRPDVFFGAQAQGYSFPSGHSVEACCFYGVLVAILSVRSRPLRKVALWTGATLLTLAIGISRIYLGVHYPTDVAGGYALAVVWVALLRTAYLVWLRRRSPTRIP